MPSLTRPVAYLSLGVIAPLALAAASCEERSPYGPPPEGLSAAGEYQVVSSFDLTAAAVLPDPVSGYVGLLSGLRTNPAGTFFAVLDEAGVPLVADLMSALPGALEDRLEGWMNEAIASTSYGGLPASSALDRIIAATQIPLTQFDVGSDLSITHQAPDGAGRHRLRDLRYVLFGAPYVVPLRLLEGLPATGVVLDVPIELQVTSPRPGADMRLWVGPHFFGFPYGEYAWQAIEAATAAQFGTYGLRGALGTLIDCAGMASSVAGRCVLGVCVGHESTLRSICERGLDLVYEQTRQRIVDLRFEALRLESGEADLWDAAAPGGPEDGRVSRVDNGAWEALIDVGMGPRPVPATFSGARAE